MSKNQYYFPRGGLPSGEKLLTGKAVFKDSYVVIPREVMTDIVTSYFPNWENTRAWVSVSYTHLTLPTKRIV